MLKYYIFVTTLGIFSVGLIIACLNVTGTPMEQKRQKYDSERLSNFTSIKYDLEDYYYDKNQLPNSLSEIARYKEKADIIDYLKDPETKRDYQYSKVSKNVFKLCTTFSTDSATTKKVETGSYYDYGYADEKSATHKKGLDCITYTFDERPINNGYDVIMPEPDLPPPANVLNSSMAEQATGTELTFPHPVNGMNTFILLSAAYRASINSNAQVSTAEYNGQYFTFIKREKHQDRVSELWYLASAPVGNNSVNVSFSADPEDAIITATNLSDIDQTNPIASFAGTGADLFDKSHSANENISLASNNNQLVIGVLCTYPDGYSNPAKVQNDTVEIFNAQTINISSQIGVKNGASDAMLEWQSPKSYSWSITGVVLQKNLTK